MTARALIVSFLSVVHEARMARIIRFMETRPLPYPPSTTRNTVSRLVRDKVIDRVGVARYRGTGLDA